MTVPALRMTTSLAEEAERLAALLARPGPPQAGQPWLAQSLSKGAAGIALLHIERARARLGTWQQAHAWIEAAVAGQVSAGDNTGLFLGLPAVAFMLDAAAGVIGRYRDALADIDGHLAALACHRAEVAMARIHAGHLTAFREYDLFFGLTGLGAVLLRRDPGGGALRRVLEYLVALTRPVRADGRELPGWWVSHDPGRRSSPGFASGHANFGAAHGICGPLTLLSHSLRRGITVTGHEDAIATICSWLDQWRQESEAGPWWPEWVCLADLDAGRPRQSRPGRPSWCYGTPGLARCGQLAGIAIGNQCIQRAWEDALARCLHDPVQQALITDAGLCHGAAGLYQTAWRAAQDAATPAIGAHLPRLAGDLAQRSRADSVTGPGLLDGAAGTALALHSAAHGTAPASGWDACLLIS